MLSQAQILARLGSAEFAPAEGKVTRISSHLVEADGPPARLGQIGRIEAMNGATLAEVVAVEAGRLRLSPFGSLGGISLGARVTLASQGANVLVGDPFAARAIDALGRPIDGGDDIIGAVSWPIEGQLPPPLEREEPLARLETGIRALDGLLTLGRGQRAGIFAASGVGKTSLIEQLAFQSTVDRVILCLVGERGREVESLWRTLSGRKDHDRFTMVAATSDDSAPCRARAPLQALSLAEYWRGQGEHVLLIIDSVTRLAIALRELGLAAGAPPTLRAYTPNVFSALPRLVERCGAVKDGGAISAVMTVLSETDEVDDPIVEVMKSLLDGHVILSRSIAEQGRFPAIDVMRSVSRGFEKRVGKGHRGLAGEAVRLLSLWAESRVLIETGAYRPGTNPALDRAIDRRDALHEFLAQPQDETVPFDVAIASLAKVLGEGCP